MVNGKRFKVITQTNYHAVVEYSDGKRDILLVTTIQYPQSLQQEREHHKGLRPKLVF